MGTTLSTLAPKRGATKAPKRLGRGRGSGTGKTSGKGTKGQKARPGHHGARIGFEGGQLPMQRRLPKRGFNNPFRIEAFPVNLSQIAKRFQSGEVTVDVLKSTGLVPRKARVVKILGTGELTGALTIRAHKVSESARKKIEKAGGKVELIERPAAPAASAE